MQSRNAVLNGAIVLPAHQPVGCGAIKKVMLPGTFPDKVPGIFWIDPEGALPVGVNCLQHASGCLLKIALPISNGIFELSGVRRHESNSKYAAIHRIGETTDLPPPISIGGLEGASQRGILKRIVNVRSSDGRADLCVIVDLYPRRRRGK